MSFIAGDLLGLEESESRGNIDDILALPVCASGDITGAFRYEMHYGAREDERPWVIMNLIGDAAQVVTQEQSLCIWAVIYSGDVPVEAVCMAKYSSADAAAYRRERAIYSEGGEIRTYWRDYYDLEGLTASAQTYIGSVTFSLRAEITVRMHHIRYTDHTHTEKSIDEITTWTGYVSGSYPDSSLQERYSPLSGAAYLGAMEALSTACSRAEAMI